MERRFYFMLGTVEFFVALPNEVTTAFRRSNFCFSDLAAIALLRALCAAVAFLETRAFG
jgi:hypothetical protein